MSAITVADVDLRVDLKGALFAGEGNKNAIANTNISIVDEKGNVVQKTRTDAKGNFQFTSLPSDQNYSVVVGEGNDLHLANLDKIFLTDANGKVVKEVKKNKTGGYHFDVLPEDQSLMGTVYVDDPWLKVLQLKQNAQNNMNGQKNGSITIIENIYYAFGDWKILPDAENILAKVVQVMKNDPGLMVEVDSHTDSRSSADFNMTLSNKRARTAVDYIVAHGIQSNRIRGVGFGETRLLNRCADGVECSDEEHAINRRTEFKITRNK